MVPTILGALWFSVFGGTAIHMDLFEGQNLMSQVEKYGTEVGLFAMFSEMGSVGPWLSVLAIVLISTFFITSADSATFVLGMLTSNGNLNPSGTIKLVWGIVQSLLACVLLYIGGLAALQTASIIAAFPFTFVILFMCASLVKELKKRKKSSNMYRKKNGSGNGGLAEKNAPVFARVLKKSSIYKFYFSIFLFYIVKKHLFF
ncbi:hypothetical protein GCM10020331_090930 [Ectobacillus funiculus]